METKSCSKAKRGECASEINPQPMANFRPQTGRPKGRSICKSCEQRYTEEHRQEAIKRSRAWNRKNRKRTRARHLHALYGLDLAEYDAMLERQKGRCAICKVHHTETGAPLNVDHCHGTLRVRGLLCHKCNRGLGLFKDHVPTMLQAIDYLSLY